MATGDLIASPGGQVTVITGSATRANGVYSTSAEATAVTSNVAFIGDFVLSASFTTAPTAGGKISLWRRDKNLLGASENEEIPAGGFGTLVGLFTVRAIGSGTQQYMSLTGVPMFIGDQEYYIRNEADQTLDSDYVLKVTPMYANVAP